MTQTRKGILKADKLKPGDLVFSDQHVSSLEGQNFNARGQTLRHMKFKGGTVFCDSASGHMFLVHQVGFTDQETVQSKLKFECEAAHMGAEIKEHCTDNGVHTSKGFGHSLEENDQKIKHSGVGGHHHNGPAENAIKNVTRKARIMMFHAALMWPDESDKTLWPLAMSHAVHLHNHTPGTRTGLSPEEIWTSSMQSMSPLLNAHPWGSPVCVLAPRLQDGQKLPKWEPRSRRGQYLGVSPLHASTVSLVRNLRTGRISPQFHCVHDDFFETLQASSTKPPDNWEELIVFQTFRSDLDDDDFIPDLDSEWLTAEDTQQRRNVPTGLEQHTLDKEVAEQRAIGVETGPSTQSEPESAPDEADSASEGAKVEVEEDSGALGIEPEAHAADTGGGQQLPRRSGRERRKPTCFRFDAQHGCVVVRAFLKKMARNLGTMSGNNCRDKCIMNLILDPESGLCEHFNLDPTILSRHPNILKVKATRDPDEPSLREAMAGPHKAEFLEAMAKEIKDLENHGTWEVVKREDMVRPDGSSPPVIPLMWVFKIKRFPDGRLRKFKARIVARGDTQAKLAETEIESWAPVASWTSIRMLLIMSMQHGWTIKQADFDNAFVQAEVTNEVFVDFPEMFGHDSGLTNQQACLRLKKSLCGQVDAPRNWWLKIQEGLSKIGFEPSENDPGIHFGRGMALALCVDDLLVCGPDSAEIDKVMADLKEAGFAVTPEEQHNDAFSFLGIEVKIEDDTIKFSQHGLIKKLLETVGMTECNAKTTPAATSPLGTDANGPGFKESWKCSSAVGMMMHLATNAHPEIQFAVHQCAGFTRCPKDSHAKV